jgi:hypothetical protein
MADLDQINFKDLESGSEDSGQVAEQSNTFHAYVFGVAKDGAISLQTLDVTSKLSLERDK